MCIDVWLCCEVAQVPVLICWGVATPGYGHSIDPSWAEQPLVHPNILLIYLFVHQLYSPVHKHAIHLSVCHQLETITLHPNAKALITRVHLNVNTG